MKLYPNEVLNRHTSFGIGGATFLVDCFTRQAAAAVVAETGRRGITLRVLGGGTNLVVDDTGVDALVLRLAGDAFTRVAASGCTLRAGAAAPLGTLLSAARNNGLAGLEPLTGIPGSTGGAVAGNSGTAGVAIGDFLRRLVVVEPGGDIVELDARDIEFGYRSSNIGGRIVLEMTMQLQEDETEAVAARMRDVGQRRARRQPLDKPSAGCVFRNPAPGVAAGKLIDEAGLKGFAVGDAAVSQLHANYVVNLGRARSRDVAAVITHVRRRVEEVHGERLDLEVRCWPSEDVFLAGA